MTQAKFIYIFGIILYTIVAHASSEFFNIHWIHIFNGLMLSSILYNLLDWKYGIIEDTEDENQKGS